MNKIAAWYALMLTFVFVGLYGAFREENLIEIIKFSGSIVLWLLLWRNEKLLDNQ